MTLERKNQTVESFAKYYELDVDITLLKCWELELNYIKDQTSFLRTRDVSILRRSFGFPTKKDVTSLEYWKNTFGTDEQGLNEILESLFIRTNENARKLPKGALKRVRKEALRRGIPLNKGIREESTPIKKKKEYVEYKLPEIGHEGSINLEVQDVLDIHYALVEEAKISEDPIDPPGVKNHDLLESAVTRPRTSLFGQLKYNSTELLGAALFHSLVHNHAFHNGNKRTAFVSLLMHLYDNNILITSSEDEIFKFILQTAQHKIVNVKEDFNYADREVGEIARWICSNSRPIDNSDRVIPWRKLQQILKDYNCVFEVKGGKMNIFRKVKGSSWFTRYTTLRTQVTYGGTGRDAHYTIIKKIRKDLRLTEEDGVDSTLFYSKDDKPLIGLIVGYRKLLGRLGKL